MIPAYGMLFLPQNPSTGNRQIQAVVSSLAWLAPTYSAHAARRLHANSFSRGRIYPGKDAEQGAQEAALREEELRNEVDVLSARLAQWSAGLRLYSTRSGFGPKTSILIISLRYTSILLHVK